MTALPPDVSMKRFDGEESLATRGDQIGDEPTAEGWRRWSPGRSKLAAMIEGDLPVTLDSDDRVLYLGAAAGTTVSHVADIVDVVYAVEFAPRPMRDLLDVAKARPRVMPLLKDARQPATYAHVVEADVDVIIQDVATRDPAAVAIGNRQFLAPDGRLYCAIKARSMDVTAAPETMFEEAEDELTDSYELIETQRLDPRHVDHLGIVARPRH